MINKKTFKAILTFTENNNPAPSFIIIYLLTWLMWHNQLFSAFIYTEGGFLSRLMASFSAVNDNNYLIVFFLTCLIFLVRLIFNYFIFRSTEILNSADDTFDDIRKGQKFAKDSDIGKLMETLTKTKQQLIDAKISEKKAITDKNNTIKKLLNLQHELDEARADIDVLNRANASSEISH